jgi:hypothetical protein
MAFKPQLLAALAVSLTALTTAAQQPGPAMTQGSNFVAPGNGPFLISAPAGQTMQSVQTTAVQPMPVQPMAGVATGQQVYYPAAPQQQMAPSDPQMNFSAATAGLPPVPAPAAEEEVGMSGVPFNSSNGDPNAFPPPVMGNPAMTYGGPIDGCPGGCYPSDPSMGAPIGDASGDPGDRSDNGAASNGPFMPNPSKWYFRGDAVWLNRDRPNNRNLVYSSDTNRVVFDTDQSRFSNVAGMRLTLGHYLNENTAIEGGYFGNQSWSVRNSTAMFPSDTGTGSGPLNPYWGSGSGAIDTSSFTGANQYSTLYNSQFYNAELGIRRWVRPTTSVLIGFRYINVNEQFQLSSFNDANNVNTGTSGLYSARTNNNLYGGQIGTEWLHPVFTPKLLFSIEAKGGLYLNAANQTNSLNSAGTVTNGSASDTQFARMVDVTAGLTLLVGNHMTLRGGYTFFFLNGVALAPDQLDTNPTLNNSGHNISDKGSMTLYGPYVGGEIFW